MPTIIDFKTREDFIPYHDYIRLAGELDEPVRVLVWAEGPMKRGEPCPVCGRLGECEPLARIVDVPNPNGITVTPHYVVECPTRKQRMVEPFNR